jgi:hypothetical protein
MKNNITLNPTGSFIDFKLKGIKDKAALLIEVGVDIYKQLLGWITGLFLAVLGFIGIRYDNNNNKRFDKLEESIEKTSKAIRMIKREIVDVKNDLTKIDEGMYCYNKKLGQKIHISHQVERISEFNHNDATAKSSVLMEALDSINDFRNLMKQFKNEK